MVNVPEAERSICHSSWNGALTLNTVYIPFTYINVQEIFVRNLRVYLRIHHWGWGVPPKSGHMSGHMLVGVPLCQVGGRPVSWGPLCPGSGGTPYVWSMSGGGIPPMSNPMSSGGTPYVRRGTPMSGGGTPISSLMSSGGGGGTPWSTVGGTPCGQNHKVKTLTSLTLRVWAVNKWMGNHSRCNLFFSVR